MKPLEVNMAMLAFPGSVIGTYLPKLEDIPKEFFDYHNHWSELAEIWFFKGVKSLIFTPKPDIDEKKALSHVSVVLRSFQPKHEHKIAGAGYLLSQFFDKVTQRKGVENNEG